VAGKELFSSPLFLTMWSLKPFLHLFSCFTNFLLNSPPLSLLPAITFHILLNFLPSEFQVKKEEEKNTTLL
jgi:hypothetical protein